MLAPKKSNVVRRYTVVGVGFGFLFPIFTTLLGLYLQQQSLTATNILQIQSSDPLYWVIDSAPVFLGLFAYFAGVRQDRINQINQQVRQQIKERDQAVVELRTLRASLEQQISRQVEQLRTAAQVAREAAEIHDVNQLLQEATLLVSSRYLIYHTGIFLLDESHEYAVLKATNSEGGRGMLQRGHRLKVGQEGIVGYVAHTGQPRIALDVGEDAVYFNNPDLPATRSEMALPLSIRGKVIGVLDVQSVDSGAFIQSDLDTLQLLADQLALAIENARLYENSQKALEEIGKLYGNITLEAWQEQARLRTPGYRFTPSGIEALTKEDLHLEPGSAATDGDQIAAPLEIHGQRIGEILLRRSSGQPNWTDDDRGLLLEVANQIASVLENARLMEQIQMRAQQERTIGQITSKTQTSLDLETVIKTAVREIGLALNFSKVQIRVGNAEQQDGPAALEPHLQEPLRVALGGNGNHSGRHPEATD